MHPRKSTQWRGFSNTRARHSRTGNAWVRDKFLGRLKRSKKAGKCSRSFIWANIPGRRTPMSPLRQRSLERVFGNWAWCQRTRYFFDDTIPASPSINPFIFGIGGSICKHTSWVDDFCNWCFQTQLGHCDNLHKSGGGRCSAWHHSGFFPHNFFSYFVGFVRSSVHMPTLFHEWSHFMLYLLFSDWGKYCDSRGRAATSTFGRSSQSTLRHKCGCHP